VEAETKTVRQVGGDLLRLQERVDAEKAAREAELGQLRGEVHEVLGNRNVTDEKFQVGGGNGTGAAGARAAFVARGCVLELGDCSCVLALALAGLQKRSRSCACAGAGRQLVAFASDAPFFRNEAPSLFPSQAGSAVPLPNRPPPVRHPPTTHRPLSWRSWRR
jgi:hypothetical protein